MHPGKKDQELYFTGCWGSRGNRYRQISDFVCDNISTGTVSAKLMLDLKIGCAIWAHQGWLGDFYPSGSPTNQFLSLYGQRLRTVEVNSTFYAQPSPDTVAKWAEETPEGFEFCPKFPRTVSHAGLLLPQLDSALRFVELMQGLGNRLGPLFLQLPPTYAPQANGDLTQFLQGLQASGAELALEVRHPQWFKPQTATKLNALLTNLGIGRVLLDTRPIYECTDDPQVASERRKPKLPLQFEITAPFSFIRYISHPDQDFNHDFMATWFPYLQTWLSSGKRVYLFVHCPQEDQSPRNALYWQHQLEKYGLDIPPLLWEKIPTQAQLNLFM
jgi:uncharacterized protein YecE (DUF72 family)